MKKIPTLFLRDPEDMSRVLPKVHPACGWVLAGEGQATRKYDGTCILIDETAWARREVKPGRAFPANFRPEETDVVTGKTVGWNPVDESGFYRWFKEAIEPLTEPLPHGTYELVGPKINGNPEQYDCHMLVRHASALKVAVSYPLTFESARDTVLALPYEGIVWHHPDGRMAKLKRRDFK